MLVMVKQHFGLTSHNLRDSSNTNPVSDDFGCQNRKLFQIFSKMRIAAAAEDGLP
jgi:hypothetical protein